jgi:hypothetical protein
LVFRRLPFKMRWLSILASSLLSAGALAAKSSADRFQEFHRKALSSSPLKLDDALYRRLSSTPREYTAAILLTAMDSRYACQLCREFNPEWELLARSWTKGDKSGASKTILATLDFNDGKDTFMSVCYNSKKKKKTPQGALHSLLLTSVLPAWPPNCPCSPPFPAHRRPARRLGPGAAALRLYKWVSYTLSSFSTVTQGDD